MLHYKWAQYAHKPKCRSDHRPRHLTICWSHHGWSMTTFHFLSVKGIVKQCKRIPRVVPVPELLFQDRLILFDKKGDG